MLVLSGLPILIPQKYEYLEKRFAKICCVLTALILCLSIVDDLSSSIHQRTLENKISHQEEEISNLKDSQAPWDLSDKQWHDLQASLKNCPKGKIEISYLISDGLRAGKFAKQLEAIFRNAGFTLYDEIGMFSNTNPPKGVGFAYYDDLQLSRAKYFRDIFRQLGIPSSITQGSIGIVPWRKDAITVRVYLKP